MFLNIVFLEERLNWVRRELPRMGGLRARETAHTLGVSVMTIWRDFALLEQRGELRRVHGGAMPPPPGRAVEPEFSSKVAWMTKERSTLARYAARRFPQPGMSIALEGGTTVVDMLSHLQTPELTLLTNSAEILRAAPSGCTIHGSGGEYRSISRTFVGPRAVEFFRNHRADLCLISATGFDTKMGLSDPNPLEIEVKREMCRRSAKVVLLLDSTKFGLRSLCSLIPLTEIDTLVTNDSVPKQALNAFRKAGVMIELV